MTCAYTSRRFNARQDAAPPSAEQSKRRDAMNAEKSLAKFLIAGSMACFAAVVQAGPVDWLVDPSPYVAQIERSADGKQVELRNGLVRRIFQLKPNAATVALDNLITGESLLRSVRPEAEIVVNGQKYSVGGLVGQPVQNYLKPEFLEQMHADPEAYQISGIEEGVTQPRFAWRKRHEWLTSNPPWPPPGKSLCLTFAAPSRTDAPTVQVHYEIYDGLPLVSKWLTVSNSSAKMLTLNSVMVEQLAVVEPESIVDGSPANFRRVYSSLEMFSDYSFGGDMTANADAPAVSWKSDPLYPTQVHYLRQTPCLVQCAIPIGPEVELKPGEVFESIRAFDLVHDSTERERRGLAVRRAYRMLAPWVQENPILMHVRSSRPEAVKLAIDQCADVGFEMVIMTFGSGFNIENTSPEYLAQIKELADYARSKGIVLGGYSLLASRSINPDNDVINPETGKPGGARFGNSPCLGSAWGLEYFEKLRRFFEQTGCGVLEHDGSYPGDVCASTHHPGHRGLKDSQWKQWKIISGFYQWCRARGIYLNVPDWYYLAGSTKCAMGYRETNWSLPRDEQEIIERQNIYDGTWEKTPSMGWMFVPLTEYHGGGAAATIEPLKDHLAHYETRLANLFGAGVQACYRGPRLYDTEATRAVVKKWVDFYRQHRAILDSDIIHLRRPDGRDWDGWLHVNPALPERAMLVVYNPLDQEITRRIRVPLHYSGLKDRALVEVQDRAARPVSLDEDSVAELEVTIPARGRSWLTFHEAKAAK